MRAFSLELKRATHDLHHCLHGWPAAKAIVDGVKVPVRAISAYVAGLNVIDHLFDRALEGFEADLPSPWPQPLQERKKRSDQDLRRACARLQDWHDHCSEPSLRRNILAEHPLSFDSAAQAMGGLYVYAGSFQGGRLIKERISPTLDKHSQIPVTSLQYEAPARAWTAVLHRLETLSSREEKNDCIQGAVRSFQTLCSALVPQAASSFRPRSQRTTATVLRYS